VAQTLSDGLKAIPEGLRLPLVEQFTELLSSYRKGDWEKVGLKAGKICEIVYSILAGHITGTFPATPKKPSNMVSACTAFEQSGGSFSRSVRIQIPRVLIATYELRNNRAIGHVGGDVDPNHMDAELFLRSCKWMVAELVRIFDVVGTDAARSLIDGITERTLPLIWEADGKKRVLNPKLSHRDKALALAYSSQAGVTAKQICSWAGYSNLSRYRSGIIADLHNEALIDFDAKTDHIILLPTGAKYVEDSGVLDLQV
jgi:hypothetical protein